MRENVTMWLRVMYETEIEEVKGTINNEHLWELGYNGNEMNPHTDNINDLKEYLDVLERKLKELE